MHVAWFGQKVPVLPLTPSKIRCIAAMFKAGQYSSVDNYLSRAKAEHIATYDTHLVPWSVELSEEIRSSRRSVLRGLGASKQSQPVDVKAIYQLGVLDAPVVPKGPLGPVDLVVVGTFFLTREVEIACAGYQHIAINITDTEVTFYLPASKNDTRAIGTSRSWGCVCGGNLDTPCPFHAMTRQLERVKRLALELDVAPTSLPLFPAADGKEIDKVTSVATITKLVSMTGNATFDSMGRELYGGHSLRTGGASMLAELGLDTAKIECLARWHSPMLLHYAKNAPLKAITSDYIVRQQMADQGTMQSALKDDVSSLTLAVSKVSSQLASMIAKDREWAHKVDELEGRMSPAQFVRNESGGIWHRTFMHSVNLPASDLKSNCGWKYGYQYHTVSAHLPESLGKSHICGRCLPAERLVASGM